MPSGHGADVEVVAARRRSCRRGKALVINLDAAQGDCSPLAPLEMRFHGTVRHVILFIKSAQRRSGDTTSN